MSPLYYGPDGATPNVTPTEHGFKVWSGDPPTFTTNSLLSASGTLQLVKLWTRTPTLISSVSVYVQTAGATLSNVGFGLYSAAGALLTSSVNANGATATAFQATGLKTVTFTTAQTINGGFYVGFWCAGTTMPALARGSGVPGVHNVNLAAPNFRFAIANTGLTTAAPATLGTQSSASVAYWVAAA